MLSNINISYAKYLNDIVMLLDIKKYIMKKKTVIQKEVMYLDGIFVKCLSMKICIYFLSIKPNIWHHC